MTARDAINSIEPGSTEYGDRQGLEANLQQVIGGAAPVGGPQQVAGGTPIPTPEDPIGALIGGDIDPGVAGPVTDGLSVGPGNSPGNPMDPLQTDRAQRLRLLATQASTPAVRSTARRMLRQMSRGQQPI